METHLLTSHSGDLTKAEWKAYTSSVARHLEAPSKLPTGVHPAQSPAITTIHVGPLMPTMNPKKKFDIKNNPHADGFGDILHCLCRDVSNSFSKDYMRLQDLLSHITSAKTIGTFQDIL
jgi:hypothetical protein